MFATTTEQMSAQEFPASGHFKSDAPSSSPPVKPTPETLSLFPQAFSVSVTLKSLEEGIRCYVTYEAGTTVPIGYRSVNVEYILLNGFMTVTNPRAKKEQHTLTVNEPGSHIMIPANTPHVLKFSEKTTVLFMAGSVQPSFKPVTAHDVEVE